MPTNKIRFATRARDANLQPPGWNGPDWSYQLPDGHTPEDILQPDYWAGAATKFGIATKFTPIVRVYNDEHTFWTMLLVRSVQPNRVIMETIMGPFYFGEMVTDEDFELQWIVAKRGYAVRRASDKKRVSDTYFPTREDGMKFIAENLKKAA